MEPRLNFVNLSVQNLVEALKFYRDGLGLASSGIIGAEHHDAATGAQGTIAYFDLQAGLKLGLYERSNLAKDSGLAEKPSSSLEFSLGYSVETKAAVAELLQRAQAAGATITAEPHNRPWGVYSAYFTDPDGHLWEVSCGSEA